MYIEMQIINTKKIIPQEENKKNFKIININPMFLYFHSLLFLIIIFIFFSFTMLSCAKPKLKFQEILIADEMQSDSVVQINTITQFDISTKKIYASVQYFGVYGNDMWKFKWINLDTSQVVLEKQDKYNKENPNKYLQGIVYSSIESTDELKIIPPAKYKVQFFHNDQLIEEKSFEIIKPKMEILDVKFAKEVDEKGAPINLTEKFLTDENVFLCLKLNYLISANKIQLQYKNEDDEIFEKQEIVIDNDYYSENYLNFKLDLKNNINNIFLDNRAENKNTRKVKVDIFLNDMLNKTVSFIVEKNPFISFSNQTKYLSKDYKFSFLIPDNWTFEERRQNKVFLINLIPNININGVNNFENNQLKESSLEQIPILSFAFHIIDKKYFGSPDNYLNLYTTEIQQQNNWQSIDKKERNYILKGKYNAIENIYLFEAKNDDIKIQPDTNIKQKIDTPNYILVSSAFENKDYIYIFIVISDNKVSNKLGELGYSEILKTLEFY